jgi:uncharacterized protein YcbX
MSRELGVVAELRRYRVKSLAAEALQSATASLSSSMVGVFDTFPLSLLARQSVGSIEGLVGKPLGPLRFRPNVLIDASEPGPFPEDDWCVAILPMGSFHGRMDKRDNTA